MIEIMPELKMNWPNMEGVTLLSSTLLPVIFSDLKIKKVFTSFSAPKSSNTKLGMKYKNKSKIILKGSSLKIKKPSESIINIKADNESKANNTDPIPFANSRLVLSIPMPLKIDWIKTKKITKEINIICLNPNMFMSSIPLWIFSLSIVNNKKTKIGYRKKFLLPNVNIIKKLKIIDIKINALKNKDFISKIM